MDTDDPNKAGTMTRSDRRRARTRQAMIDAGPHVIAERGLDRLTIASITEAADVALGSFYNHFADREEYLAALTEAALESWLTEVRSTRSRPFQNELERWSLAIAVLIAKARQDEHWREFLTEVLARDSLVGTAEFVAMFKASLEAGRASGHFNFDELDLTARFVAGTIRQALLFLGDPTSATVTDQTIVTSILRVCGVDGTITAELDTLNTNANVG